MKEKEEDEENKIRKFAYKHTDNQVNKQSLIQKLRHTLILCGSSGERANKALRKIKYFLKYGCHIILNLDCGKVDFE